MSDGKVVAIIPARSGSKRLPGKNVRELAGRPLLAYSIMVAGAVPEIDEVWVSSDSESYLDIAREWGATRNILRTPTQSLDTTSTLETLHHALLEDRLEYHQHVRLPNGVWVPPHESVSWVILLQPNCPLRTPQDIQDALGLRWQFNARDGLLSVQPGPFKIGRQSGYAEWKPQYQFGCRKQNMIEQYREDGNLYIFRAENIFKNNRLHGKRMAIKKSRPEQSLANIDTQFDFDLTEFLFHHHGYDRMFDELEAAWKHLLLGSDNPTPSN